MMKLIKITTLIEPKQYDILKKNSYEGKKKNQKENELTFSEHIRIAIEKYTKEIDNG